MAEQSGDVMHRLVSLAVLVLFSLPVTAQVTGTIITDDGVAIEGAAVMAFAIESSAGTAGRLRSESPERALLAAAKTDGDGRFALNVEGHEVVDLLFTKAGHAPSGVKVRPVGEIGAFVLRPAKMVRGTVSHDGEPVAGAAVRWATWTVEVLVRTDEAGRYEVPDPAVWKPSLEVHHPSLPVHRWSPDRFPATYSPPDADVVITARKVSGIVVTGPEDTPVAEAQISVDGVPHGVTSAEGTFVLEADPKWKEIVVTSGDLIGSAKRGAEELRIKLSAGGQVTGRVVDERGRGVRQALVTLTYATLGYMSSLSESLVTGDDGAYASDTIAAGKYRAMVLRSGFTTGMSEITVTTKSAVSKEIVLSPAAIVEGTVRDEERRPVAAVQVGVEDRSMNPFPRPGATTGPDGRYVILDAPGEVKTKVTAYRKGYPNASSETFETRAGVRMSGVDVTMSSGYEVTGRVLDASGAPVAGALVGAAEHPQATDQMFIEFPGMERIERPTTDGEGKFALRVGKGTWFFAFKAAGYVVKVTEGKSVESSMSIGDVTLDEGGEIAGRVVRVSGMPVEGAGVGIRDPGIRYFHVVTDEEGRFTFRDLPRRTFDVTVYKADGSRATKAVEVPSSDVLIELPDAITLRGRVVDAETSKPISDFMLGVTTSQPGGAGKSPYHAEDGSFEVEAVPVDGLALAVSAAGYAESKKLVDLVEGEEPEPVEIGLARGIRVHGTVKDESGRPLEGVSVGYDKHIVMGRTGSMTMRESQVTTDANGTFSFDSVSPGKAQFGFSKQGYLRTDRTIEATGREQRLDVEMSTGVALRGIVVDESGAPVAGANVRGTTSGASRVGAGMRTVADGRFTLEPLEPGRVTVYAGATGYADTVMRDVETASTPELRIVMERGATVEGRVSGIEGSAMQEVALEIGDEQYERRVNPAGEFRIEGVRPGRIVVAAYTRVGQGYRSARPLEIDLAVGETARVEIEFVEGNVVRGVVTLGEMPLAGASIRFRPKDTYAGGYVSTRADADGRYEAVGLVDGDYRVTVSEPGSNRWFETGYQVRGPAEFDIHFDEGKIEGRVVEAGTRKPVSGATVSVEAGSPGSVSLMTSTAVSDDDGRFVILSAVKGSLRVTARKEGYGAVVRELASDGTVSGVELEMARSSGTKLYVVDARDGRALLPVVTSYDLSGNALMTDRFQSMDQGAVMIDLVPGQYLLEIGAGGYAARRVRVTVPSNTLRVALTPGGRLVMRAPLARSYRVTIRDEAGNVVRGWPGAFEPTILVEGSRTIPAIAPGEYTIEARPVAGGETKVHRVRIEEGATREVELE
jgi:protocatechuate 3,4-dioxygenase beta subunit